MKINRGSETYDNKSRTLIKSEGRKERYDGWKETEGTYRRDKLWEERGGAVERFVDASGNRGNSKTTMNIILEERREEGKSIHACIHIETDTKLNIDI